MRGAASALAVAATISAVVVATGCSVGSDPAPSQSDAKAAGTAAQTIDDTPCWNGNVHIPCVQPGWYPVSDASMEPTLHCAGPEPCGRTDNRNRVKATNFTTPPERFDLVVTAEDEGQWRCAGILRIVGLPGEIWEERRGIVYINGKRLDEPYMRANRRDSRTLSMTDIPPKGTLERIPVGMYLLMRDNRTIDACDSRTSGLAPSKPNKMVKVVLIANWLGEPTGVPARGY